MYMQKITLRFLHDYMIFQVTSGVSDTRQVILDNLNQSNDRKLNSNLEPTSYTSPSSTKNISPGEI